MPSFNAVSKQCCLGLLTSRATFKRSGREFSSSSWREHWDEVLLGISAGGVEVRGSILASSMLRGGLVSKSSAESRRGIAASRDI